MWHVTDHNNIDLAYKVYHPTDLDKPEKISRFNRGYRAMEQLDHPHIVKVHKYTECPIGFTMDFVKGGNSRDYVGQIQSPSEAVAQLLVIAETLKHAHGRGVIHRDVKPENIVLRWLEDEQCYKPYLTDFDLAWFSTATQFTREGLGSLIYASPEQLAKPNSAIAHAETTDIYAFGQLCFFYICRHDPVPTLSDCMRALENSLASWRIEEPAAKLEELYDLCTKQQPEDRIGDFREICDRLFEISQLLAEDDHQKNIGFDHFCKQLAFSVVGMSAGRRSGKTSFSSVSGQTLIEVRAQDDDALVTDVLLEIQAQDAPVMHGAAGHKAVRDAINRRIDAGLRRFGDRVARRAGTMGVFNTTIRIKDVSLNVDGVEFCYQVLMRVIDCIEGTGA